MPPRGAMHHAGQAVRHRIVQGRALQSHPCPDSTGAVFRDPLRRPRTPARHQGAVRPCLGHTQPRRARRPGGRERQRQIDPVRAAAGRAACRRRRGGYPADLADRACGAGDARGGAQRARLHPRRRHAPARHRAPAGRCRSTPRRPRPGRSPRRLRRRRRLHRPGARPGAAARPRLHHGADTAAGGELLGRLAHAAEPGAGADVPVRPAAAR